MIPREQIEATQKLRKKRRRIILFSILGVIVLLVAYIGLSGFTDVLSRINKDINVQVTADDWPVFQHDLHHTGANGFSGTLPQGQVAWTFETGAPVHSSPAVVDGVVYIGSQDNYLYALDALTGDLVWKFKTGSWVEASPIVVSGVVYCGSNDGNLYAIDAATGAEIWHYDVTYPIRGGETYADGVIYFGADDWSVHAVDAATGNGKWSRREDNNIISPPVVVNGIVVIGGMDGFIYCINAATGHGRLAYPSKTIIPGSPVYDNGIVYLSGSNGYLFAIDPTAKNWPLENQLRRYWSALYLYGVAPKPPDLSGWVWSKYAGELLAPPGTFYFQPIDSATGMTLADNVLILGVGNTLLAVDKDTQEMVWNYDAGGRIKSSTAVAGDGVFFGSDDGNVYALDRTTGAELWQYHTDGPVTSSPAVAGSMLYVGSESGTVYAFK